MSPGLLDATRAETFPERGRQRFGLPTDRHAQYQIGQFGVAGRHRPTSGDIFVAFSTASPSAPVHLEEPEFGVPKLPLTGRGLGAASGEDRAATSMILSLIFQATVEATEEAIVNALIAADDMTGRDGRFVPAIPHAELQSALRKYNLLDVHRQEVRDGA